MSSVSRPYTDSHASFDITADNGTGGTSIARSRVRPWPISTMVQSGVPSAKMPHVPTRNLPTSSMGFCVADRPMRVSRRPHSASSRSSDSARWLPRLLAATAWISSTITVRAVARPARPESEPSSTYSDSGVVTRMCGGERRIAVRSACGVSPVRTAVRIATSG